MEESTTSIAPVDIIITQRKPRSGGWLTSCRRSLLMIHLGQLNARCCQGMSRREMLQIGACSALGLSLPQLLASQAHAKTHGTRVKAVLLLWQWGGPSHHETWDPKPDAPAQIRGCF